MILNLHLSKFGLLLFTHFVINLFPFSGGDGATNGSSCATVKLSSGDAIDVVENNIISRKKFETARRVQLTNAIFSVTNQEEEKCVLEICGYRWPPDESTYENPGFCKWFSGGTSRSPTFLYDQKFEVTSMGCACKKYTDYNAQCRADNCSMINPTWDGSTCAILFQEENCQQCIFDPLYLHLENQFYSLNSYQVKSLIVRPGCTVSKWTNGAVIADDSPYEYTYTNIDFVSDPVYHKDSENFSCNCERSIILETIPELTTLADDLISEDSSVSSGFSSSSTESINGEDSDNDKTSVLQFFLPLVGFGLTFLIIIIGAILARRILLKRRGQTGNDANTIELTEVNEREAETRFQTTDSVEITEIIESSLIDPVLNQQISPEMMEKLKKYVESLFESSKKAEEINIPSRNRVTITGASNFNAVMEQFYLLCEPQFVVNPNSITIEEELGCGQFGVVYKGVITHEIDGLVETIAIKKLKWVGAKERILDSFFREVKIFQFVGVNHKNIVRFVGASCSFGELYIFTKLCENGSLENYLKGPMKERVFPKEEVKETVQKAFGYLIVEEDDAESTQPTASKEIGLQPKELSQLLHWAEQIANGMAYLHHIKIIHFDLAVRNVLLSASLVAKIGDLGLSRKCSDGKDYSKSLLKGMFPPNSFAPECNTETSSDEELKMSIFVDIWAFGCTVWEIFSLGEEPYPDMKFFAVAIANFLKRGGRLAQPELAPDFVYAKLMECWNEVPSERPSFVDLWEFFREKKEGVESLC